jgi:hypothetical protein
MVDMNCAYVYICVRNCACLEITLEIYVYTCVPISALLELEVTAEMADPHPTRLIVASTWTSYLFPFIRFLYQYQVTIILLLNWHFLQLLNHSYVSLIVNFKYLSQLLHNLRALQASAGTPLQYYCTFFRFKFLSRCYFIFPLSQALLNLYLFSPPLTPSIFYCYQASAGAAYFVLTTIAFGSIRAWVSSRFQPVDRMKPCSTLVNWPYTAIFYFDYCYY